MSHMFKVLLNEESQERGVRPALEGRCIVAFRHVRRPKRRGDFRAEPEG